MGIPNYPVVIGDRPELQGFYDGLAVGELRLTANAETGAWLWYPPEVVPGDMSGSLIWKTVSGEGSAFTFTTITRSLLPGDHKAEVPFTVVLFESDDAPGCRVPGVLVNADGIEPACGMRLRLKPVNVGDHMIAGFEPLR